MFSPHVLKIYTQKGRSRLIVWRNNIIAARKEKWRFRVERRMLRGRGTLWARAHGGGRRRFLRSSTAASSRTGRRRNSGGCPSRSGTSDGGGDAGEGGEPPSAPRDGLRVVIRCVEHDDPAVQAADLAEAHKTYLNVVLRRLAGETGTSAGGEQT